MKLLHENNFLADTLPDGGFTTVTTVKEQSAGQVPIASVSAQFFPTAQVMPSSVVFTVPHAYVQQHAPQGMTRYSAEYLEWCARVLGYKT